MVGCGGAYIVLSVVHKLIWGRILKMNLTKRCLLTNGAFPNGSPKASFHERGIVYTKIFKGTLDVPLHEKAAFLSKALLDSPANHIARIVTCLGMRINHDTAVYQLIVDGREILESPSECHDEAYS